MLAVLEIGTYVGFSLLVWLDAVGSDGWVTGLESNAEFAKEAVQSLNERGYRNFEVV